MERWPPVLSATFTQNTEGTDCLRMSHRHGDKSVRAHECVSVCVCVCKSLLSRQFFCLTAGCRELPTLVFKLLEALQVS